MWSFKKWRAKNEQEEYGQSLVEVALILLLVALAAVVIINVMEPTVANVFSEIVDEAPLAPPAIGEYTPPPTATIDPFFTPSATPTPSNTPIPSDTPTPTETPSETPTPSIQVSINFQRSFDPIPAGYEVDGGNAFGDRGNGYSYGWSSTNTGNARDRDNGSSPGQEYDTLNHMQLGGTYTWEIAVPNGTHEVYIVAGDPSFFNSVYVIEAEGVVIVSGTPSTGSRWVEGTGTVTVSDGRLTITSGAGASNNKIDFIQINPP